MAFQRQNWQTNDTGILRKKDENEEELLVFGYSCKLFRDDEKALYIDQGKHLIPWMGDESLRIDRYDVRGALYDLSQYEAISGQQEELFWINLSSEERRIQQLCDEERYRALTHNEDEERLYQEEELKRLHQALGSDKTYGQVSYSYDDNDNENGETEKSAPDDQTDDPDEPFVPPPELDLPVDINVPETVKLNAIIEKTAMFINQQGSQMEIILKMKQATNPQFEFLSYRSPLHAYYRHVLGAIKSGHYRPKTLQSTSDAQKAKDEDTDNISEDQHYYLHHTLSQVPSSSVDVAPVIPSINYKPSSDCAYSMLVNKIRNNQNKMALLTSNSNDLINEIKKEKNPVEIVSSPKLYDHSETSDVKTEKNSSETIFKPLSPVQIVAPQRPSRRKRRKRQQGAFAYNDALENDSVEDAEYAEVVTQIEENHDPENVSVTEECFETPPLDLQLIIDKMACYVAKNGRDFEEIVKSKADARFSFLDSANPYYLFYRNKLELHEKSQKPNENSNVVENLVESSTDSNYNEKEKDRNVVEDEIMTKDSNDSTKPTIASNKPNPVCFSIKRPKETESLEIKSALPVEESSDEDNEENEDGERCTNENATDNNNDITEQQNVVETGCLNTKSVIPKDERKSNANNTRHAQISHEKQTEEGTKENICTKKKEERLREKLNTKDNEGRLKERPTAQDKEERLKERLTTRDKEKRSKDRLTTKDKEERVKQKLTKKDKEKHSKERLTCKDKEERIKERLNAKDKEKQLQLERKKRAAAFLNLIQKTNKKADYSDASVMIGPQLPDDQKTGSKSDLASENEDGTDLMSSPPSSVTSPDVTIVGESIAIVSPKIKASDLSSTYTKSKRSKYSSPEKRSTSCHLHNRDDVEYKHKHRKRKRSQTPTKKHHSHSGKLVVHRSSKEKHRKHHRHRKEGHHSHNERDYSTNSTSSCVHRRHKHYKMKKHKRRQDDKKSNSSSESNTD